MNLHPVILAGGCGTRLWPMSREAYPKQFLPLLDGASPFEATLERTRAVAGAQPPTVVANHEHRFLVADQVRRSGRGMRALYTEPFGRGTAPALALVASDIVRDDPEALLLVLPADHDIPEASAFAEAVDAGKAAAAQGHLVVFGSHLAGRRRATATSSAVASSPRRRDAARSRASWKSPSSRSPRASWTPDGTTGTAGCSSSRRRPTWPSSRASSRSSPRRAAPRPGRAPTRTAGAGSTRAAFERCRAISIDHAVLERTRRAAMVPARFRWSDIGSWDALWERGTKDAEDNRCEGDVQLHDVSGSYIHASHRLVVGIGLEDLVVVETPDAVLVAHRAHAQRVREAVERLRAHGGASTGRTGSCIGRGAATRTSTQGDRFRVKRITVDPGRKLSLQWHHHRAEHWIVVSGTARVTRGGDVTLLTENQSLYIAIGELHRLENPGKVPLQLIEVQTGTYLGKTTSCGWKTTTTASASAECFRRGGSRAARGRLPGLAMCGIVGAIARRNVVPDPPRRPAAARIPRLRLGGHRRGQRQAAPPAQHGPRIAARAPRHRKPPRGHHRHRPHPLGDPRRPVGSQRPSPRERRHLRGAQRHHREPRGDARAASPARATSSSRRPIPR